MQRYNPKDIEPRNAQRAFTVDAREPSLVETRPAVIDAALNAQRAFTVDTSGASYEAI